MPATKYGEDREKLWAQIDFAHRLWGHYRPGSRDPFRYILKISESDYLFGFFPKRDELVKYLFLANLAQSLYDLGRQAEDRKRLDALKTGELKPSDLIVWPVWTLMKPDDFKSATWDLFGTSEGVLKFVFPKDPVSPHDFWALWKRWKEICVNPMERGARERREPIPRAEWLTLPGEPPG